MSQNFYHKMQHAQQWMQQQVQEAQQNIVSNHTLEQKVILFLSKHTAQPIPEWCLQHILSAEMVYSALKNMDPFDGTAISILYQKALDICIETYITQGLRQFVLHRYTSTSPINHPLEKSLYQVIHQWYSLSTGRLYDWLTRIKNKDFSGLYSQYFSEYLSANPDLHRTLLSDQWYGNYEKIIQKEMFSSKRHTDQICLSDIDLLRKILVWDIEDENCLVYKLIQTAEVI